MPNFVCILQAALTQLIQYYHRFQKILSQHPFKRLPIRSELINIHHVMVEVKKHKTTFWMIEELSTASRGLLGFCRRTGQICLPCWSKLHSISVITYVLQRKMAAYRETRPDNIFVPRTLRGANGRESLGMMLVDHAAFSYRADNYKLFSAIWTSW